MLEPTGLPLSVEEIETQVNVLMLNREQITNWDRWYATIEIIEQGYDPVTKKPLTQSTFDRWVAKITQEHEADEPTHNHPRRRVAPQ